MHCLFSCEKFSLDCHEAEGIVQGESSDSDFTDDQEFEDIAQDRTQEQEDRIPTSLQRVSSKTSNSEAEGILHSYCNADFLQINVSDAHKESGFELLKCRRQPYRYSFG